MNNEKNVKEMTREELQQEVSYPCAPNIFGVSNQKTWLQSLVITNRFLQTRAFIQQKRCLTMRCVQNCSKAKRVSSRCILGPKMFPIT